MVAARAVGSLVVKASEILQFLLSSCGKAVAKGSLLVLVLPVGEPEAWARAKQPWSRVPVCAPSWGM